MKKVFYTLGLTVVFNIAGAAQKTAKPADKTTDRTNINAATTNGAKVSKSADGSASFSAISNLQAQLQNTLDTKNAKVGDQVVLKTTQSIKQNGQTVIPKGSELIGRITGVQQRAKNNAGSEVSLVFDQLKNGRSVTPITATIVSMINTNASSTIDPGSLDSGLGSSGSTSTRGSSGSSGSGLLGGVNNTVGGLVNGATQTVGGVTNTAGQTLGNTTSTLGQTVNGIQISANASGSAQGTTMLSSPNKNIRLEKGVTFNLNVQKTGTN